MKRICFGAAFAAVLLAGGGVDSGKGWISPAAAAEKRIVIGSFKDFTEFFDGHGYSIAKWKAGKQDVPRFVILDLPEEWRKRIAPELPVPEKKRTFFRLTIPMIFVANSRVAADHAHLEQIRETFAKTEALSKKELLWLEGRAREYGIEAGTAMEAILARLAERMDIIPPSLMVAQMAEESGWGTSRFAAEGNAFFGQWSWHGGMRPEDKRKNKGNYSVEAFKTPLDSIHAYMVNLNSNEAYEQFRKRRAKLRSAGKKLTGPALVGTLIDYSERREAYVRILNEIMESNQLPPLDDAALAEGETVYIALDRSAD